MAPLSGTTVPRGELQALVVLHRLILTVVEAFPYRFLEYLNIYGLALLTWELSRSHVPVSSRTLEIAS